MKNAIRRISQEDLSVCLSIIHQGFATVAEEFGLTEKNCPGHTAFMKPEKLREKYDAGDRMYLCEADDRPVGFFSIKQTGPSVWELDHLSVLSEYRRRGFGEAMLRFVCQTVKKNGGEVIQIGIIEENTRLKRWYERFGFVATGTKRFAYLPFTVGFMELRFS